MVFPGSYFFVWTVYPCAGVPSQKATDHTKGLQMYRQHPALFDNRCPLESLLLDDKSTLPGGYLWQQGLGGVVLERLVTSRDLLGLYQRVKSAA